MPDKAHAWQSPTPADWKQAPRLLDRKTSLNNKPDNDYNGHNRHVTEIDHEIDCLSICQRSCGSYLNRSDVNDTDLS